jgi:hypothetical protein
MRGGEVHIDRAVANGDRRARMLLLTAKIYRSSPEYRYYIITRFSRVLSEPWSMIAVLALR